jgi:hypothetical protein
MRLGSPYDWCGTLCPSNPFTCSDAIDYKHQGGPASGPSSKLKLTSTLWATNLSQKIKSSREK